MSVRKIKKGTLLFLLITNCLLILFAVLHFVFYRDYAVNSRYGPAGTGNFAMYLFVSAMPAFAALTLYIGLYWILRVFKEAKILQIGVIAFFAMRIIIALLPRLMMLFGSYGELYIKFDEMLYVVAFVSACFLLVPLFFVKHPAIRKYYIIFACLMVPGQTFNTIGNYMPSVFTRIYTYEIIYLYLPFIVSAMLLLFFI